MKKREQNRLDQLLLAAGILKMEQVTKDEKSLKKWLDEHPLTKENQEEIGAALKRLRARFSKGRIKEH